MTELHFLNSTDRAKCKHVYARSRRDIKSYLQFVSRSAEDHGYQVKAVQNAYANTMAVSKDVGKEVNETLQNMGLVESGSTELTPGGEFAVAALESHRTDIFDDIMVQHMRVFPTMAYIIDIVVNAEVGIDVEKIEPKLRQSAAAESSFEENSIRNCLNLISEFDIIEFESGTAKSVPRSQVALEAIPYAILLLADESGQVIATTLHDRLPQLLHCSHENAEELFTRARSEYSIYTHHTRGDRDRLMPFGNVFEIDTKGKSPKDLISLL